MTNGLKEQVYRIYDLVKGSNSYAGEFSVPYPAEIFKPRDDSMRDGILTFKKEYINGQYEVNLYFDLQVDTRAVFNFEEGKSKAKKTNAGYEFKAMAKNLVETEYQGLGYLNVLGL